MIEASSIPVHQHAANDQKGEQSILGIARALTRPPSPRADRLRLLAYEFLLTGGQFSNYMAGLVLLEQMPAARSLHGDKGYYSNAIR